MPAIPRWRWIPQVSSFEKAVVPPDVDPDEGTETTVCFSEDWLPYVLGALSQLQQRGTWQGTDDEKTVAVARATALMQLFDQPVCASTEIQAPFWQDDSGDDADDEATPAAQDWYGTWDGETFLESLAYVFLTNFLSTLVSPTAAIRFLTIPRAFRVAIRQNPHGANLLLFLDGGLYKVINGYSPFDRVAEFLIASPGTEMLLVHAGTHDASATPDENGNYIVDVIRGRLDLADVTNPNVRYNGDPPVYQVSMDGGTTWVDQPSADPRHAATSFFPPLTPYEGLNCDAAERMTAQLRDSITTMCDVADAAQAVTNLLELILLPTGLVGMLLSLLFLIADWIIDNGQETILAAFTDDVYDDIKCKLSCKIEADGSITQTKLDEAWEEIKTAHAGTVATVIDEVRFLFTDAIFSNAAVMRTETGDCTDCDCGWCFEFDLTVDDAGIARISGCPYGTWVSGTGWRSDVVATADAICTEMTFTSSHITSIELTTDWPTTPTGSGAGNYCQWLNGASPVHTFTQTPSQCVSDPTFVMTLDATINHLIFNPSGFVGTGLHFAETHLKFKGLGDCPFGEPNCEV